MEKKIFGQINLRVNAPIPEAKAATTHAPNRIT
jgi:hypothetical protein